MSRRPSAIKSIGVFAVLSAICAISPTRAALPPAGVYSFFDGPRGTLAVTATGTFTGNWTPPADLSAGHYDPVGPYSYRYSISTPLSGSFSGNGTAWIVLVDSPFGGLFLQLTFVPGDDPSIEGRLILEDKIESSHVHVFTAWPRSPAGALAGNYTAALLPSGAGTNARKGIGAVVITVKPAGGVLIRGRTGDGHAFSTTAKLRSDNRFWLKSTEYRSIYFSDIPGQDLAYPPLEVHREIQGLVELRGEAAVPELEGTLQWSAEKVMETVSDGDITKVERRYSDTVSLHGFRYTPPPPGTLIFDFGNDIDPKADHPVEMALEFGGLPEAQTITFPISRRQGAIRAGALPAPFQQLQFNAVDVTAANILGGTFQGLLQFNDETAPRAFFGVIIPNENAGVGYFQGPPDDRSNTGTIRLFPVE